MASVATTPVRDVLLNEWDEEVGDMAEKIIDLQLADFQANAKAQAPKGRVEKKDPLFESALKLVDTLGVDEKADQDAIQALPQAELRQAIWGWAELPYSVFRPIIASFADEARESKRVKRGTGDDFVADIDLW